MVLASTLMYISNDGKELESLVHETLVLGSGPVVKFEGLKLSGKSVASNNDLLLSNLLSVGDVIL
jgi:hypothetical protein